MIFIHCARFACVIAVGSVIAHSTLALGQGVERSLTASSVEDPGDNAPPEAIVDYLLFVGPGSGRMNPRTDELLALLRQSPRRYVVAVQAQLSLPDSIHFRKTMTPAQRRFGGAMGLAVELGREHGGPLLHIALGAIDDRIASVRRQIATKTVAALPERSPEPTEVLWTLDFMRGGLIQAAERIKDPSLVPYVLNQLSDMNLPEDEGRRSNLFVMLRYLAVVAPGDTVAFERLKTLIEEPGSQIAKDSQARRTLVALGQGRPPATVPSTAATRPGG